MGKAVRLSQRTDNLTTDNRQLNCRGKKKSAVPSMASWRTLGFGMSQAPSLQLPYDVTADIRIYYFTTLLLYYFTTLLLYYFIALLLYCSIALLLYSVARFPPYNFSFSIRPPPPSPLSSPWLLTSLALPLSSPPLLSIPSRQVSTKPRS